MKNPLDFLEQAQTDPKLSKRITRALERGNKAIAGEVLEIAKEFGYSFTRDEFEKAVQQNLSDRFAAGETHLIMNAAGKNSKKPNKPLESSCAKGCLSYTTSWHPSKIL